MPSTDFLVISSEMCGKCDFLYPGSGQIYLGGWTKCPDCLGTGRNLLPLRTALKFLGFNMPGEPILCNKVEGVNTITDKPIETSKYDGNK